ncbi:MAG: hypothetical protein D6683_10005 [Actinomyces sp.]|nr:MAG: hypothetical protein D6683_10005 [Actinomyces sp.]
MTTTLERPVPEPAHPVDRGDEFAVEATEHNPGRNLPQRVGAALWGPMFAMALMAFAAGMILAIVRADIISDRDPADADTILILKHLTAAAIFLGFASVFSAITFAVAKILGEFRSGGGSVQESLHADEVQTLKMPLTAKGMLVFMMMGMMAILGGVIGHVVVAAGIDNTPADLLDGEQAFIVLQGIRRFGVVLFLVGIALGLTTIIRVLRFQAVRIREVTGA